jgi:prepilin-type N-terminal cleavage/methylation domain-containing protein
MAGALVCARGRGKQTGFTLAELLIAIAIIALLAGILLPVAVSAMHRAREAPCMGNLRQLYVALSLYREDHGGNCPAGLFELVPTYAPPEVLLCPEDGYGGYADALAASLAAPFPEPPWWETSAESPTSYLYAGSYFRRAWWEALSGRPDTACVTCWLHGRPVSPTVQGPFYTGRTLRLHLDGSVTTDDIVHFKWQPNGYTAYFTNQFDPDGVLGGGP